MNFKEALALDAKAFINLNEFASEHLVNGKVMAVVLDSRPQSTKIDAENGTYPADLVFTAFVSEFGKKSKTGDILYFDQKQFLVESAEFIGEMVKITGSRMRG